MSFSDRLRAAVSAARQAWFREAAGITVDDDDDQWRRLTGDARRDLSPMTQRRMRDLATYLWQSNPLANRIIELPVAYLLAEGVRLTVPDPDAQNWLDAFWNDPINSMSMKLPKKVRELALYGEQCWPAFTNEVSGHVRLGYLDPDLIETVVRDPDNPEQAIGVVTVKDKRGESRRYRTIVNGPEEVFTARTREIRQTFGDGEAFFFTVNDLSDGTRGRSDLLAQMDWLDGYDQFMFGELERSNLMRAFIWDVTLDGATPEEVKARARDISAPSPGSVRVHNSSEKWDAVTASLQHGDSAEGARLFRNHILGGGTIPEHWYGGGGDVNRATGDSMGEPTFKVFSMRQQTLRFMLEEVARFQISRRLDPSGRSGFDPANPDPDLLPTAEFPELTARDTSKYAAALGQVTAAAAQGIERGLMSEDLGLRLIAAIAARLGVEIDPEEELVQARAEASARRAEQEERDRFPDAPTDPEDAPVDDAAA